MGDPKAPNGNSKGYTPGWNDPPLFSYDSQTARSSAPKKTNILTKRVAFPLQPSPSDTSTKPIIDPTLPPSVKSTLLPPPCSSRVLPSANCDNFNQDSSNLLVIDNLSKEEVLSRTLSNTESVINDLSSDKLFLDQVDDIRKKIDILKKMWEEDKLTTDILHKVYELSNALAIKDVKAANHLQVGLMVDHASLCSSWISAFRLLIHFRSEDTS